MPRRDFYHDTVKNAIIKDGWTITDDPLELIVGFSRLLVDLGGEKVVSLEKVAVKIAAEVKNFRGESDINELEKAMGQYALYEQLMKTQYPNRMLYLAVEERVYLRIFCEEIGQKAMEAIPMNLLVFNDDQEVIIQWIENGCIEKL